MACACFHTEETGRQSGVQSCTMPGLPSHLVREFNTCTVEAVVTAEAVTSAAVVVQVEPDEWSKALLLTASASHHYTTLVRIRGACEKVTNDLGLCSRFCWVLPFPPPEFLLSILCLHAFRIFVRRLTSAELWSDNIH